MTTSGNELNKKYNLLVISDTHLGEGIKHYSRINYLKQMGDVDSDLCDFLAHYAENRKDNLPWRLVINGDFLDFSTVTVTPSLKAQEDSPSLVLTQEERRFGLSGNREKAVWKLDRIVDRHRVLLAYLADFVGHGHCVDFLYGNHDAEFFWPEVKQRLADLLEEFYFGGEDVKGDSVDEYRARIQFHEWFFYRPQWCFIEHGNQYDEFSNFKYRLNPVSTVDQNELSMPVSHLLIRYFVNKVPGFSTHNKDNWTLLDFLRWTFKQGWYRAWFILKSYLHLSFRVLQYSHELDREDDSEIRRKHENMLEEEAEKSGIDGKNLRRLDSVRPEPVHHHLGGALQSLSIDLWIFCGVYLFVLLVIMLSLSGVYQAGGFVLWTGALVWRRSIIAAARRKWFSGVVKRHVSPKLANAAVRIGEILKVPYVIMGHSHDPIQEEISEMPIRWYINSGCWLRPPLSAHEDSAHYTLPLNYVLLPFPGTGEAELLKWKNGQQEIASPEALSSTAAEVQEHDDSGVSGRDPMKRGGESRRTTVSLRKRRY